MISKFLHNHPIFMKNQEKYTDTEIKLLVCLDFIQNLKFNQRIQMDFPVDFAFTALEFVYILLCQNYAKTTRVKTSLTYKSEIKFISKPKSNAKSISKINLRTIQEI